jgi:hypothetical protein
MPVDGATLSCPIGRASRSIIAPNVAVSGWTEGELDKIIERPSPRPRPRPRHTGAMAMTRLPQEAARVVPGRHLRLLTTRGPGCHVIRLSHISDIHEIWKSLIPDRLAALGHPQRLAILRLLMRRFPDRLPAGDIAQALDLKASTLSNYLSHLMQVGLVTQERSAPRCSIAPDMDLRGTFGYLFNDCCRGRPDLCPPFAPFPETGAETMTTTLPRPLHLHRQFRPVDLCRDAPAGRSAAAGSTCIRPAPAAIGAEPLRRAGAEGQGARRLGAAVQERGGVPGPTPRSSTSSSPSATAPRTRNARPGPDSRSAGIGACPTRPRRKARRPSARWRSRTSTARCATGYRPSWPCRSTRSTHVAAEGGR